MNLLSSVLGISLLFAALVECANGKGHNLCGGSIGPILRRGHNIEHELQVIFLQLARKADRLRLETIDLLNFIKTKIAYVDEVVFASVPACNDYINSNKIFDDSIPKTKLITVHFDMLVETRAILDKLKLSFGSNSHFTGTRAMVRPLQHLKNRYAKSLMCEISTLMHMTGQSVSEIVPYSLQLCDNLDIIGRYEQGYFLLNSFRYIDDVLSLNNTQFGDYVERVYPKELEIKDTTYSPRLASYLDIHLEICTEGHLKTKLYYKRDDFNFSIVNFPFICSNTIAAPAYGVYILQLIRYTRACDAYIDSGDRGRLLTSKLMNQEFLEIKLKSSLLTAIVIVCSARHIESVRHVCGGSNELQVIEELIVNNVDLNHGEQIEHVLHTCFRKTTWVKKHASKLMKKYRQSSRVFPEYLPGPTPHCLKGYMDTTVLENNVFTNTGDMLTEHYRLLLEIVSVLLSIENEDNSHEYGRLFRRVRTSSEQLLCELYVGIGESGGQLPNRQISDHVTLCMNSNRLDRYERNYILLDQIKTTVTILQQQYNRRINLG